MKTKTKPWGDVLTQKYSWSKLQSLRLIIRSSLHFFVKKECNFYNDNFSSTQSLVYVNNVSQVTRRTNYGIIHNGQTAVFETNISFQVNDGQWITLDYARKFKRSLLPTKTKTIFRDAIFQFKITLSQWYSDDVLFPYWDESWFAKLLDH